MARINIEDSLFKDNRFFNLSMKLGSKTMALGAIVELYIVAQEYWKRDRSLIPKQVWHEQGLNNALIDVYLVEEKDHGFYVKDSEQMFSWLWSKVKNGQKGGNAQKLLTYSNINNLDESESKRIEAIESAAKPLTLTLPHTHIQYSNNTSTGRGDLMGNPLKYPQWFSYLKEKNLNERKIIEHLDKVVNHFETIDKLREFIISKTDGLTFETESKKLNAVKKAIRYEANLE